LLPNIDISYPSPLGSQQDFYEVAPPVSPCLFQKNKSPVFWEELSDWQTSLNQEEYIDQDVEPSITDKLKVITLTKINMFTDTYLLTLNLHIG
jgi:hypothetical protein